MKKLLGIVKDLLLPPRCLISGKILQGEMGLAPEIFKEIYFIADPFCEKCGAPLNYAKMPCIACNSKSFFLMRGEAFFYIPKKQNN